MWVGHVGKLAKQSKAMRSNAMQSNACIYALVSRVDIPPMVWCRGAWRLLDRERKQSELLTSF